MSSSARYAISVLVGMLMLPTANATVVSGTFAGIARDASLFSGVPPIPTFDGASVTGSFQLDTTLLGSPLPESPDFVSYVLSGNALKLSFTTLGNTYDFGTQGLYSSATVFNNGDGQVITFAANVLGQTDYAALFSLGGNIPAGASGLYADGLDLSTFHAVPVDMRFAGAGFQLSFDVGAFLELSDVRFDAVSQVPEPSALMLLLTGLALLMGQRCMRRTQMLDCPPA